PLLPPDPLLHVHHLPPLSYYLFSHILLFHPPAPTEIYTLSLHDALPIYAAHRQTLQDAATRRVGLSRGCSPAPLLLVELRAGRVDRKSTRLNSSHVAISYAVFCLKKKKNGGIKVAKDLSYIFLTR